MNSWVCLHTALNISSRKSSLARVYRASCVNEPRRTSDVKKRASEQVLPEQGTLFWTKSQRLRTRHVNDMSNDIDIMV